MAKKPITDKVTVYQDSNGKWRWQWKSGANGNVLADSGQGYASKRRALLAVDRVVHQEFYADVEVVEK